jgi:putative polyketide hydroxylase
VHSDLDPERYDVLVVGAGPAGLTTACGLARAGVRVLVVDKHAGTTIFPKATGVRPRTLEILRSWTLEQRVLAAAQRARIELGISPVLAGPLTAVDTLGAPEAADLARVSPSPMAIIPQDRLEPVLLDHLRGQGGEVRFSTGLVGFELDDARGVRAWLRRAGSAHDHYEVQARYLVGADGPRSTVRARLGIDVEHLGAAETHVTGLFAADLDRVVPDPPFALHAVTELGAEGVFVACGDHRWGYGWTLEAGDDLAPSADRVAQRVRAAAGLPDLDLTVLGVFTWRFEAEVATRFRNGPAFLAGDAAARTTPRRATGMNTGIGAAHNLAWKLAWVLRGWAGAALLDTYEEERLPVGRANAARSLEPAVEAGEERLAPDFGVRYASATIQPAPDRATGVAGAGSSRFGAGASAGARAPHGWIGTGADRMSTLDLFDGRLTLLTGRRGGGWCAAAARLAVDGPPIRALRFGPDLPDPDGGLARLYRLGDHDAVLIRPDGHVAWRSDAEAPAAGGIGEVLRAARDLTVGRQPAPAAAP